MKTNDERTYHPYGVSYWGGGSHGYKHSAPLALMGIDDDNTAAEQRDFYNMSKPPTERSSVGAVCL
ncbi:MAG: hypothetical protein PGMFKBFP_03340 [Anaerolineales bacterium]|nr:hypothetical protein [Anaerolineales bacterium]